MNNDNSAGKICQQIREDSQKEAEAVIQKANRNAGLRIKLAQGEAKRYLKEQKAQAAEQVKQIEQKVLAGVKLETKRIVLRARERIIDTILQEIRKKGAEFRQQKEYENWLLSVIAEGVRNIGEKEVLIVVSKEDATFTAKIKKSIEGKAAVEVRTDEALRDTGAIVKSADGRKEFANTFSVRLERMLPKLRLLIAKEIFRGEE